MILWISNKKEIKSIIGNIYFWKCRNLYFYYRNKRNLYFYMTIGKNTKIEEENIIQRRILRRIQKIVYFYIYKYLNLKWLLN